MKEKHEYAKKMHKYAKMMHEQQFQPEKVLDCLMTLLQGGLFGKSLKIVQFILQQLYVSLSFSISSLSVIVKFLTISLLRFFL